MDSTTHVLRSISWDRSGRRLMAVVCPNRPDPSGICQDNTAGPRHDEGSQLQAAPITKHKGKKLPKLRLSRPVTGRSVQILSSSLECGELVRGVGDGNQPRTLGYCETPSMSSLDLNILAGLSSHARDMFFVGLCRCDVYPTVT
jgi:hypothetical protein